LFGSRCAPGRGQTSPARAMARTRTLKAPAAIPGTPRRLAGNRQLNAAGTARRCRCGAGRRGLGTRIRPGPHPL